jgi:uncharacterized membrane protein YbaN (DUF454 family)
MELTRLIAVHFAVATVMSLGFLLGPMLNRAFIATTDKLFARRRRRSERWLLEVRTLEDALSEQPTRRTYAPLPRTSKRSNAWR